MLPIIAIAVSLFFYSDKKLGERKQQKLSFASKNAYAGYRNRNRNRNRNRYRNRYRYRYRSLATQVFVFERINSFSSMVRTAFF